MYLVVEPNDNCDGDERMFKDRGDAKPVRRLRLDGPDGAPAWFDVTGVDDAGAFRPAEAVQVDDSSDGTAWLVFGGAWGLRFRKNAGAWSLTDPNQWGAPFKVMDSSGRDVEFG